jgi:hypothetical protein
VALEKGDQNFTIKSPVADLSHSNFGGPARIFGGMWHFAGNHAML